MVLIKNVPAQEGVGPIPAKNFILLRDTLLDRYEYLKYLLGRRGPDTPRVKPVSDAAISSSLNREIGIWVVSAPVSNWADSATGSELSDAETSISRKGAGSSSRRL